MILEFGARGAQTHRLHRTRRSPNARPKRLTVPEPQTHRVGVADSPCRSGGLTVSEWRTHPGRADGGAGFGPARHSSLGDRLGWVGGSRDHARRPARGSGHRRPSRGRQAASRGHRRARIAVMGRGGAHGGAGHDRARRSRRRAGRPGHAGRHHAVQRRAHRRGDGGRGARWGRARPGRAAHRLDPGEGRAHAGDIRVALLGKIVTRGDAVSLLPRDVEPVPGADPFARRQVAGALGAGWTSELLTVAAVEPAGAVAVRPSTVVGWEGGTATGDVMPPTEAMSAAGRPRTSMRAGSATAGEPVGDARVEASDAAETGGRGARPPNAAQVHAGRAARRRHRGPRWQRDRRAPPRRVARAHLRPPGAAGTPRRLGAVGRADRWARRGSASSPSPGARPPPRARAASSWPPPAPPRSRQARPPNGSTTRS